jgi:hypothetical protein
MLLKYLGFSTDSQDYVVAKRENPHCSALYSTAIYERFHVGSKRQITCISSSGPDGGGDLMRDIKQRLTGPNHFVVPCSFQVTHIVNEFPAVAWRLHISDFFSGQPTHPDYVALPKPAFSQDRADKLPLSHFSGELVIMVPAGFKGEPDPVNRVHYLAPLPAEVIEQCSGPCIEQVNQELRTIQGSIKYTRFERTRITCEPIGDPALLARDLAAPAAGSGAIDAPRPTLALAFSLTYFIVTMGPP